MTVNKEDETVFKAYLRNLMRQLKQLEKAVEIGDEAVAAQLINELIEDTQKNIED